MSCSVPTSGVFDKCGINFMLHARLHPSKYKNVFKIYLFDNHFYSGILAMCLFGHHSDKDQKKHAFVLPLPEIPNDPGCPHKHTEHTHTHTNTINSKLVMHETVDRMQKLHN